MSRQKISVTNETFAEVDSSLEALNSRIVSCVGRDYQIIKTLQTHIEDIARDEGQKNSQRYAARAVAELLGCADTEEQNWIDERATKRVRNALIEFVQVNFVFFEESKLPHIRNRAAIFRCRGFALEKDLKAAHDHCLFGIAERHQDSAKTMIEVGRKYDELSDKENAEICFTSAAALNHAEARYFLARCKESVKRKSGVISSYEQAAKHGISQASLALAQHYCEGSYLVGQKDHSLALIHYVDALSKNNGKEASVALNNFNPDYDSIVTESLTAAHLSRAIIEMAKAHLFDKLESGFIGQFALKKKDQLSLQDLGLIASTYHAINIPHNDGCSWFFAAKKEKSSLEIIEELIAEKVRAFLEDAGLNKDRLVDEKISFDFSDEKKVQCRFKFKMQKNPMAQADDLPNLDRCSELDNYRYSRDKKDPNIVILSGDLVKNPSAEIVPNFGAAVGAQEENRELKIGKQM